MAHAEALRAEDPDSQLAQQVGNDYHNAGLTPKQVAMLEFAEFLTLHPANVTQSHTQELRDAGWTDEDIVDIVHISALFNYMVRVADGLGIELQADRGWDHLVEKLDFHEEATPKDFGNISQIPVRPATTV
ncbi:MAG: peroxidase-related enzyme [Dehalococcoidia bacterium]